MKVQSTNKEKEFEPIYITITIENEQELCDLAQRLRISSVTLEAHRPTIFKWTSSDRSKDLYSEILSHVEERNLKVL